jgi:signal transduction histidine kinase
VRHPEPKSVERLYLPADGSVEPEVAALLLRERARAEGVLNRMRAAVVALLGIAAVVYAPEITPTLARVNVAVLAPVFAWTLWQQWRYHRPGRYRRWLAWVNPAVDVTAITLLQAGYGLAGAPGLAVHTPVFLAYFAVLASRPLAGSARQAALTTAATAAAYGALSAAFVLSGRLHALASPLDFVTTNGTSLLDEGTKVLMLLTVGAISTYATAWNDRTLRRALAAQVRRAAEERELATRLQEADKLSAIGTIAAAAVHDVRNPLTTIGLQAELLLQTKLDDSQREDVQHVLADARRAAAFVEDLLRVTRGSTAPDVMGSVSLSATVESALTAARPLLRDQQVTAKASFDLAGDASALLEGSTTALERAVLNLIVNAVQAMEGQRQDKELRIEVSGGPATGEYVLLVADTGPGFPQGLETRAFERFFTTKPPGKGTGLGLWIVRETVGQFGGSVAVEAAPGRGARIRVTFPCARPAMSGDAPNAIGARRAPSASIGGLAALGSAH